MVDEVKTLAGVIRKAIAEYQGCANPTAALQFGDETPDLADHIVDAILSLGGVQDRSSGSVAGCADAQSVLPRRSQGVATPSEGALEALRNHQQQLDQDGVMVGVSRQALDECLAAFAPELTADFTRSLPGGKLDDSEYEAIESALDKADAPCQGPGGRWLTLAERIAALVPEGVAIKPEADGEASKPKVRATEHKDDSNPLTREGG